MAYKVGDPNPYTKRPMSQLEVDRYNATSSASGSLTGTLSTKPATTSSPITAAKTTTTAPKPAATAPTASSSGLMTAAQTAEAAKTGINPVTGQKLSDVQLASVKSQTAQLSGAVTPAQAAADRQASLAKNLAGSQTINRYTFTDPTNVQAQYDLNKKLGIDTMTGFKGAQEWDAQGNPIQTKMPRDFAKEQEMMKKLGITSPTPDQTQKLFEATYTPEELQAMGLTTVMPQAGTAGGVAGGATGAAGAAGATGAVTPTAGGQLTADQLAQMGLTPEKMDELVKGGYMTQADVDKMKQYGTDLDTANKLLSSTAQPTNTMLGVLESALKAKSGVGNQALGESELFKAAGLGGYAVLAQSLAQRGSEMDQNYNSYSNIMQSTAGAMSDVWNKALQGYKYASDNYNTQVERVNAANKAAIEWEHTLELAKKQVDLDIEKQEKLYALQEEHRTANWQPHDVLNADGTKTTIMFDATTGEVRQMKDADGKVIGGEDYQGDYSQNPTAPEGYTYIGDEMVQDKYYNEVFGCGTYGGQCGTWASTISTASKVGNTWGEKKTRIQANGETVANGEYMPKAGDKLLVPLAVKSGKGTGHVAVVTSYDPTTGDISVVEANKGLDGIIHRGKYNLNDLTSKYGANNFGFVKGELKSGLAKRISEGARPEQLEGVVGSLKKKDAIGALKGLASMGLSLVGEKTPFGTGKLTIPEEVKLKQTTAEGAVSNYKGVPKTDTDWIVKAIMDGEQPPEIKGLYGKSSAVKAGLAKQGFDFQKANLDWQALQKYTATMNGSKILQLRTSAQTALDSLDLVTNWSNKLEGLIPRNQFPVLNKAAVTAAKNGAFGQEALEAATMLDQQISDISGELATVYRGGNGATDEALKLGATQLSSDWNKDLLNTAISNIKDNLSIRINSYKNIGPATYEESGDTSAVDPLGIQSAIPTGGGDPLGIL